MGDYEKILLIRALIGDVPSSPFYPLFTDETLEMFLLQASGDIMKAARYAAISASFSLAGWATRERTGDIEVWNSLGSNYLAALKMFLSNTGTEIPSGLMPWSAGLSRAEMCEYANNPDMIPSKLLNIFVCDSDNVCNPQPNCGC